MIAATHCLLALLSSLVPPGSTENPPDPAFKDQVVALAAKNDHAGIAKLVKQKKEDAIAWIVATCEKIANEPSDDAEKLAEALKAGWKEAALGEFAEREYKYFKEIGPNRRARNDLKDRLDAVEADLAKNLEHKDGLVFQNAVDELDVVAPGLEQEGDWYRASQAWIAQAQSYDEEMRGETAEPHKAWLAYGHALEARDKIDLKDPVYEEIAKRKAVLLSKGADKKPDPGAERPAGGAPPTPAPPPPPAPGAPPGAPAASGAGAAPASTSGPITAAATFDAIPAVDTYLRPNYAADEIFLLWNGSVELRAKGSTSSFQRFTTGPPLIRAGKSDVRLDTNGDGQGDEKVPIPGTPVLVKVNIGKGETARPWACLAQVGGDKDSYQGVELNNLPTEELLVLFAVSAASITANVGGVPIRIIDDDADSIYGNVPLYYANAGLGAGEIQIEMDSIVIGASKRARPWSEIQQIGDKWWKLEVDANAKEVKATPADVQTGTLKLDFQGPTPPTWIVVQGTDTANKNVRFDLVEGGSKGVVVPVGRYALIYGEIRKGKRKQVQKVVILPGKSSPTWQVEAGKTATVSLGAPFGFDFKYASEGEKLKVEGMSVVVVGKSGERYERAWACVPRPEVFWRKKGNKTAANKGEKMAVILDPDTLAKLKVAAAWFPLDIEVPLKGEKSPVEVQLVEKKHELFGKIESEWK
jgi:hypothetical protein